MNTPENLIDPNVKIPAAIRATAARADEAFKAAYQPEGDADAQAAPAENVETTAENAPAAPVTPQSNEPAPRTDDEQSWEHRYKSMKGRYERSEQQIRSMSEQITSLQNVIATLQTAPTHSAPAELQAERLITAEEEQDYGAEFLNVVGKRAKEELLPIVKTYEQKIAELEAKLSGATQYVEQDARARMQATLDRDLPSWREINQNQEFIGWLRLPDPYSGVIRHELLKAAYQRNDTPRVLAFFNGFLSDEAAVDPANAETSRSEAPAKPSLEQFAAPGRAKTAAADGAPAEKPLITRAQIAQFYTDVGAGKYRGRDAEKNKLEAQIFDAQREGRIR